MFLPLKREPSSCSSSQTQVRLCEATFFYFLIASRLLFSKPRDGTATPPPLPLGPPPRSSGNLWRTCDEGHLDLRLDRSERRWVIGEGGDGTQGPREFHQKSEKAPLENNTGRKPPSLPLKSVTCPRRRSDTWWPQTVTIDSIILQHQSTLQHPCIISPYLLQFMSSYFYFVLHHLQFGFLVVLS